MTDIMRETGYETQGSLFAVGLEEKMVGGHLDQLHRLFNRATQP